MTLVSLLGSPHDDTGLESVGQAEWSHTIFRVAFLVGVLVLDVRILVFRGRSLVTPVVGLSSVQPVSPESWWIARS